MDQRSYANKLGYMLETPVYPLVLASGFKRSSDNPCGADNQQERLFIASKRILRDYTPSTFQIFTGSRLSET